MDSFIWDFHSENYVSVQIKKKLDSLFSANHIRENNGTANQSKASVRVSTMAWHDTTVASCYKVHFQETPEFSQNWEIFLRTLATNNQNNQSGRFPALQEEEIERQKSKNVHKNTLKLSTKTWLIIFNEWWVQRHYMLVQFVNNWMRKLLWYKISTRSAASSNLAILEIFFIQLFTYWTACGSITYTFTTALESWEATRRKYAELKSPTLLKVVEVIIQLQLQFGMKVFNLTVDQLLEVRVHVYFVDYLEILWKT